MSFSEQVYLDLSKAVYGNALTVDNYCKLIVPNITNSEGFYQLGTGFRKRINLERGMIKCIYKY